MTQKSKDSPLQQAMVADVICRLRWDCSMYRKVFCVKYIQKFHFPWHTVFENHRKSLIQIASEASYVDLLSVQKSIKNVKKWSNT